jgi:prepilin-type N-terminal cleavage/methylation domain-containing protein
MRRKTEGKVTYLIRIIQRRSGFTLIELIIAMVVLLILALIAFNVYTQYISKAKITVAESTLAHVRDNLNLYNIDNGKYPDSINFTDCVDENSRMVFSRAFCNQLSEDLYSIENYSYNSDDKKYSLTARAKDNKHTLITVTSDKITK